MSDAIERPAPMTMPEGYKANSRGALIPIASIKPEHLLEDELAQTLTAKAQALSAILAKFKAETFAAVDAYMALLAQQYGAKPGGDRGNLTLSAFDGSVKVQVAIGDKVELGPELQIAKTLIDACIRRWSDGASSELRTVVMDAFQVDKQGRIDTNRVLQLRRLQIADEDWQRAMEAISNSVRVTHSKRYVRFYVRVGGDDEYAQVPMDLAKTGGIAGGVL
jgi:hypothetical protein